jgi:hypothetical protein
MRSRKGWTESKRGCVESVRAQVGLDKDKERPDREYGNKTGHQAGEVRQQSGDA